MGRRTNEGVAAALAIRHCDAFGAGRDGAFEAAADGLVGRR